MPRRVVASCLGVCLGALTACGDPSTVEVESSESTPAGTLPPVAPTAAEGGSDEPTETGNGTNGATGVGEPTATPAPPVAFLTANDLPGWSVDADVTASGEPLASTDCEPLQAAFDTLADSHDPLAAHLDVDGGRLVSVEQSWVPLDGGGAEVVDQFAAAAEDCVLLTIGGVGGWTEPWQLPETDARSAAISLGAADGAWVVFGAWETDGAVIVTTVTGEESWRYIDPVFALVTAKVDGTPIPELPSPPPMVEVRPPADDPPPDDPLEDLAPELVPPLTLPDVVIPDRDDGEFPPSWEDWADHPLAALAPDPAELGPGWAYEWGRVEDAAPADPDDAIDGCDAPPPPTLDSIGLDYEYLDPSLTAEDAWNDIETLGSANIELELLIGDGDATGGQQVVDSFRAVASCEPESVFATSISAEDWAIFDAADDTVVLVLEMRSFDPDIDEQAIAVFAVARYGELTVAVYATGFDAPGRQEELRAAAEHLVGGVLPA